MCVCDCVTDTLRMPDVFNISYVSNYVGASLSLHDSALEPDRNGAESRLCRGSECAIWVC